jgi:cytochrome oxidase Cu insertion factor (SCO1/SenC/PrrC family)
MRRLGSYDPRKRGSLIAIAAIISLLIISSGLWAMMRQNGQEDAERAQIGGPFHLIASNGSAVTDQSFRGRYSLIYFGYTGCPDVCPTTLTSVVQALEQLGARGADIRPVFITVDPERDTPRVLSQYVAHFSPRLIGLTGTASELRTVEAAYHVVVKPNDLDGSIDHSAVLYLMGPDGRFLAPLPANGDAKTIAAGLARYIS